MTGRIIDDSPMLPIASRSGRVWRHLIGASAIMAGIAITNAAQAGAAPSAQDIEAISHTLGFIKGMPQAGALRIGIVCNPGDEAHADIKRIVDAFAGSSGPGTTSLIAVAVAADAIKDAGDLHALLLMPGTEGFAHDIVAEATRRRVVTVSTDPECLVVKTCVLWVQAEPHVAVTLDTALAETLSVRVSPIFAMMVKRR
jgi:hypothetical protein